MRRVTSVHERIPLTYRQERASKRVDHRPFDDREGNPVRDHFAYTVHGFPSWGVVKVDRLMMSLGKTGVRSIRFDSSVVVSSRLETFIVHASALVPAIRLPKKGGA